MLTLWLGIAAGLFLARISLSAAIAGRSSPAPRACPDRFDPPVRSPEVRGPIAFGIFDRVIAVPADFDRLYDERERRLALDHELAHHRSGDLVANLFAFVLLCLQWFNPLAWVAHAAFRFDQEAACDARVLDKAKARDRADYGRAIAKAASGRALLFASALDRRNTLHRRLKSMLNSPTTGRRTGRQLMVLAAVAVALPLTATRAIDYVDVPATRPAAPSPASAGRRAALAVQPVAPVPGRAGAAGSAGADPTATSTTTRSPSTARRNSGRSSRPRKAGSPPRDRPGQGGAGPDQDRPRRDRARSPRGAGRGQIDKEELRRDLAEARAEIEQAMREIDAHAADIRRSGQDPELIKAQVRASLKAVEAIDVEAITRQALASVDHAAIEASVASAEARSPRRKRRSTGSKASLSKSTSKPKTTTNSSSKRRRALAPGVAGGIRGGEAAADAPGRARRKRPAAASSWNQSSSSACSSTCSSLLSSRSHLRFRLLEAAPRRRQARRRSPSDRPTPSPGG